MVVEDHTLMLGVLLGGIQKTAHERREESFRTELFGGRLFFLDEVVVQGAMMWPTLHNLALGVI